MLGELFLYDMEASLAAFESHLPFEPFGSVIFIGGLGDGFMTCPIVEHLTPILTEKGYSLVQFLMSSSYRQYGTSSLSKDCQELCKLIRYLQAVKGRKKLFLLGHSTGCQDIFWYLRNGIESDHLVYGANIQAPVSDRDFLFNSFPEIAKQSLIKSTELLALNKPNDLLPEMIENVPMTAYRINSLLARLGDDDYFSSDLTLKECKQKFPFLPENHATFNSLNFSFSLQDEFVQEGGQVEFLIEKLVQAYPFTREPIILPGNHDLSTNSDSMKEFCNRILQEVQESFNINKS